MCPLALRSRLQHRAVSLLRSLRGSRHGDEPEAIAELAAIDQKNTQAYLRAEEAKLAAELAEMDRKKAEPKPVSALTQEELRAEEAKLAAELAELQE